MDYYYGIFSKNSPPTLFISANQFEGGYIKAKELVKQLIFDLSNNKSFKVVTVDGGHDVHFTNPERMAQYIIEFLDETGKAKVKL